MKHRTIADVSDLELVDAYIKYGSVWKVSAALGLPGQTIHKRLALIGATKPVRVFTENEKSRLIQYYTETPTAEFDLGALAAELGRTKSYLCRQAGLLGLTNQARPASAAHTENMRKPRWQNKPHPRGATGMKHTEETKEVFSAQSKARWAHYKATGSGLMSDEYLQKVSDRMSRMQRSPETIYSRGSAGRRPDLGEIYFRSSWEANYARYLNWLVERGEIERWEYEPETFWFEAIKRGVRSYKPDFKIWERGKSYFVEVKGWMDPKSKTKLKRMAKYFPDVKIVLVDKAQYTSIKNSVSGLIPNWETAKTKQNFVEEGRVT